MVNELRQTTARTDRSRYFQLWMGTREIAHVDVLSRRYDSNSLPRVERTRARRHAIRWYWLLIKLAGIGESMSPEETVVVLRQMKVDPVPFIAAVAEMGWSTVRED